jgi:hypothetical protein
LVLALLFPVLCSLSVLTGIICEFHLFLVIGVGNIVSAVLSFRIQRIAGFAGLFFGFGLVIWLFVQINLVGGGHWLQYLYFVLSIIQLLLGIAMRELERKS